MSKIVRKEQIISEICSNTYWSRYMVSSIVDSLLDNIIRQLSKGNRVQLYGFGTFRLKEQAKRTGRNPLTNEVVPIPARVVPSFTAGERMKKAAIKNK